MTESGQSGSWFSRGVRHPASLLLAGAWIGFGLLTGEAVVWALGAGLWALSVAVTGLLSRPRETQADVSALPPSLQRDLLGVTTALDQLREAVRAVPAEQKPMFEGIQREAAEVRSSVVELAQQAGALHRHLEATRPDGEQPPGDAERRERMLSRLEQYRETLQSLETTARELADRAVELAAGAPMRYDTLDDRSPERKISEMKASMAAIEEVVRTETEML